MPQLLLIKQPRIARRPGLSVRRARNAFTLLELLLVTTLVLSLAGALVFSFSSLMRGAQLEEGAGRIETLVRFARAQAANTGRKVQLVFEADKNSASNAPLADMRLTWESDPLGRPGRFEDMSDASWQAQGIRDLVQVEDVQLGDPCKAHGRAEANQSEQRDVTTESSEPLSRITFYPDGTSDSAEIILCSAAPEEEQRMSLRIVGITGAISRHMIASEPFANDADEKPAAPTSGDPAVK
jgi:type II secretory pathway pseudopilin PulG